MKVPNEKIVNEIENLYSEGTIDEGLYFKFLLSIASDYLIKDLDTDNCQIIINRIPMSYYETKIFEHMEADESFAESMIKMSYKLIQIGIFDFTPTINTRPAEA